MNNTRQNITRLEWSVRYEHPFTGTATREWRGSQESAERWAEDKAAKGWVILAVEQAEHLLDY